MKENDAKMKWCPMVRHEGDEPGSFNRGGITDPINAFGMTSGYGCGCIASGCMMWRWTGKTPVKTRTDHGYCGLAGKP